MIDLFYPGNKLHNRVQLRRRLESVSLIYNSKSPRRPTHSPIDLCPHLPYILPSRKDGSLSLLWQSHVDGDPSAEAGSHHEAASCACMPTMSPAQNKVRSPIPLRQLRSGTRAVRASYRYPASAAAPVHRVGAVRSPSTLRVPASAEQHKFRTLAHADRGAARVCQ